MKELIQALTTLAGRIKDRSLAFAGKAAEAIRVGIAHTATLIERMPLPRFRYDFECWGPVEHLRGRYVELRDAIREAELGLRHVAADALERMRAEFKAIPLELKWADGFSNLVTTAGGNDLLTQYFKGSAYTAAWFVGLIDNAGFSAIAAGDTAASHAGWTEAVPYSNGTRPALTLGTAASKSIDNSASKASYTINATATINGAFTITNSTKSGTSGTLYSAGSFGSTRAVANGDTLNIQVTLTV